VPALKPIGFLCSFAVFAVAAAIFASASLLLTPYLADSTEANPLIIAQLVNTLVVFVPIFTVVFVFLKRDGYTLEWKTIKERLCLRRIRFRDFLWMVGSLLAAAALTAAAIALIYVLPLPFELEDLESVSPVELRPLVGCELAFLLFFPVSFFFNYVGEELLWRGYLFPRQELVFGKLTWVVSGLLHLVFHLHLGWSMLLFVPVMFALAFVFYKTRNTYLVIIMHALLGAPTDLLLAAGVLS
jgi:membrane protease YdiL (CAAX protease family)